MLRNLFIMITFFVGITLAILFARYHATLYGDFQPPGTLVEIPKNTSSYEVAQLLKEKGIIKNTRLFLKVLTRNKIDKKIRAGIYEFSGRPYINDVIDKLIKGRIAYLKLVFPEGITCREIGKILEQEGICESDEFEKFTKEQGLEGFLFPDTYKFPYGVSKEAIVKIMIGRFWDVVRSINPEMETIKKEGLIKIVTIASLVEKEAEINSERPIIAGIFYNRLKRNMPLQSCATIKYVIGNKKNLTLQDLKIRSPFNTYRHRGLPPSPICNPGKKSLEAAIYPSKTSYLFFVSKGDGSHYFSTTYSEHLSAKNFYLNQQGLAQDSLEFSSEQ